MGLVQNKGSGYALTDDGRQFVKEAIEDWAGSEWTETASETERSAAMYETTVHARMVDPEFRATVISRHSKTCPISGVDHPGLLDVAHVLSWSEYPEYRADLTNVLPLSKTHHAAFDREFFTIDREYRLRVNPSFETQSDLLKRTILEQDGERVAVPTGSLNPDYLTRHNEELVWM